MNRSYENSSQYFSRNNFYNSKPKKFNNDLDNLFEQSLSTSSKNIEENYESKQYNKKQNYKNELNYENENNYQDNDNKYENNYQYDKGFSSSSYYGGMNKPYYNGYNSKIQNYKNQNKFENQNHLNDFQKKNLHNSPYEENADVYYEEYYYDNVRQNSNNYNNSNKNSNPTYKSKKRNNKGDKNKILTAEEKSNKQKFEIEKIVNKLTYKAPELTYNLINELIDKEYECMICNDNITQSEENWSCEKCYTIYHIKCIYDWIFKLNSEKAEENQKTKKVASIFKWSCPHCNCNYNATTDNLPKYNCYCKRFYKAEEGFKKGLEEYKDFNPDLVPHGCGLICNTKICNHVTCGLPCHPGPHLQCSEIETLTCFCGNSKKDVPCNSLGSNSIRKFTCEKVCEKLYCCKRHKCKALCHEGDCEGLLRLKKCEECTIEAKLKFMNFLNGLETKIKNDCKKEVKFAEDLADYIFHGMLLCKNHFVETNTDDNLRLLLKLVQISGNSLIENIKKFIPICKEIVTNSCNCQSKSLKTECYKLNYKDDIMNFLSLSNIKETPLAQCTKVCKAQKSCKNHSCDRVCCELANVKISNYSRDDPDGLHLCLIICGKELNCGIHKCENYCHRGNCLPCKTIIREGESICSCGNTKIKAPFICGSKPQCKLPCIRERICPHPCLLNCHDGPCPECEEIVIKMCNCGKIAIQNVKCGEKELPKCNTICDEMLPCGAHFCDLICHNHNDEYDKAYFCNLACNRQFKFCKHICKKRCHGESDCWEIECDVKVKINCKCKVNSKDYRCGEVKKLSKNFSEKFFIACNDECKRIERLKKIEVAFDGLFKYNQEKNRQLLKGKKESKTKESPNKSKESKTITRNWGKKEDIETKIKEFENNITSHQHEQYQAYDYQDENKNENGSNESEVISNLKSAVTLSPIEKEKKIQIENLYLEYEEYNKRICDVKFSYKNLNFACSHVKFIIDLEKSVEKAMKNLTTTHEINSLDKKEFIFASEFLRTYYNIETEKIKKGNDLYYHILLKNCHEGKIPRIKLSLLALLMKSHKFVNIPMPKSNEIIPKNKIIFHPFEMSIYIQDYRLHITPEAIDAFISSLVTTDNFYVNEINKGKCYVHFFDKYNCKKVYKELKNRPSQFQDCYEVEYYHEENWRYEDFYSYLKNEDYFKYLNELEEDSEHELIFETIKKNMKNLGDDKNKTLINEESNYDEKNNKHSGDAENNEKEKNKIQLADEDGFIMVTKKKKK